MDAVFQLAEVLTVMVNGKVLATGAPAEIRANREVQERLSRQSRHEVYERRRRSSKRAGCTLTTAPAMSCTASISRCSAGEAIGLMGRNGMGKTTLIRALVGHVPPRRGEVRIQRPSMMTRAVPHRIARQGIAYVPEGRGIFPNLTVKENLIMAARSGAGGRTDWTYERVLETFPRLAERLSHGGQQLSGGEQQMLSIGRALMTNPTLLILDEATEGLAPLDRAGNLADH